MLLDSSLVIQELFSKGADAGAGAEAIALSSLSSAAARRRTEGSPICAAMGKRSNHTWSVYKLYDIPKG